MRITGPGIFLAIAILAATSQPHAASAASIAAIACPGVTPAQRIFALRPARCVYTLARGFHPTHDGGPWINIDLLHDSYQKLKAIHDGYPKALLFQGGPPRPPLDLVHAQICLSDADVSPGNCPNNYPDDAGNSGLGYRLNPKIIPLLRKGFENARKAGLKVVLRFTYNFPCNVSTGKTPPKTCYYGFEHDAPLDVILRHMRQLAPVVQGNSDVIYSLQAGFIGRWGEWHNSYYGPGTQYRNGTQLSHNRFLDQYTALFRPYVRLEVRDPFQLLDYATWRFGAHDPAHVLALGIGLHDDAYGSDATDKGTFLPQQPVNNPKPTPYERCELRRTFLAVAHAYHTTAEPSVFYQFDDPKPCPQETYSDIVSYSQQSLLTTFQLGFNDVLASWIKFGYYDEMVQSAGPHLSLVSADITARGTKPQILALTLENTGWAAISGSRPAWLIAKRGADVALLERFPIDLTRILPGQSVTVAVPLVLSTRSAGTYDLNFYAPDPSPRLAFDPLYALFLENRDVPDVRTGVNRIASVFVAR